MPRKKETRPERTGRASECVLLASTNDPSDTPLAAAQVSNATAVRLQVLDAGWGPIPVRGKRPVTDGWQLYSHEPPSTDEIELWGRLFPQANNTGIALGRQVAVDIDVSSDPDLAHRIRVLAVEHFGETPFVRVGQPPKVALIYRPAEPIATRHFKAANGSGDGIDILSDGTQIVSFGDHPDTGKPYQWTGPASPLDAGPGEAPEITEAQVEAFLDRVHALMPLGAGGNATGRRPNGKGPSQQIIRNDAGLVVDGRERFLAACIWKSAGHLDAAGKVLTLEAVAGLAWASFTDPANGADLHDQRWTERHARGKARATIRRLEDGKASFRKASNGQSVAPTYPDHAKPVVEARRAVEEAIRQHLEAGAGVHAVRVATGVGKTSIAAKLVAEAVKAGRKPFLYAVPRHRLGDEIALEFKADGVTAHVFRGREAPDPDRPGETMCDDLAAVQTALELGAPVSTSCCKGKAPSGTTVACVFFDTCHYQRQLREKPDIWIVAHQLLFQSQTSIGEVAGVFIDESFWQAGVWGVSPPARALTLDEIAAPLPLGKARMDEVLADVEGYRAKLTRALRRHPGTGGVAREHLVAEGLTADDCTAAIKAEWKLKGDTPLWPGMPAAARRKAAETARGAKHVRSFVRVWDAARELLDADIGAVSGRLLLADLDGGHGVSRVVKVRGVKHIAAQWDAPTLVMDATLPDPAILEVFFPGIEVIADIDAAMPYVTVRQVLGAPVSARKLGIVKEANKPPRIEPPEGNRNLQAIRRAILHRHLEVERKPTLVIAQKSVAEWLKASGLPPAVSVEHFNNISGLDGYRDVRLLITIGRTLPNVIEVEGYAGALTGLEPTKTEPPAKGPRWFDKTVRGIRLKDGTGYAVETDVHPDPTAEAVRWQICVGELVQALGRARGVNRTQETPLTLEVWADVVLPITVDEVVPWEQVPAGAVVEMLAAGVWLDSPTDMAKAWPKVWGTEAAAKQWRDRFTRSQTLIENILYRALGPCGRYQLPGARQKWRTFRYAPNMVPDPRAWLEARFGPLAGFDLAEARAAHCGLPMRPHSLRGTGISKRQVCLIVRSDAVL